MGQASLTERVFRFAGSRAMFSPGDRVGVAVSGGADSVCLLHLLLALRERWQLELSVIHVDHQLRGAESLEDAQFVAQLAFSHELPFYLERATVDEEGNQEENARRLRLAFFERLRQSGAVNRIATGHTASDQAETVLFRFLRGCGATGLAGVLPVTREGLVRPLLALNRTDVVRYLRQHGIGWREDSTNRSALYTRNRIRHELIPMLTREYQPALVHQLSHLAAMSHDEDVYWEELTAHHYSLLVQPGGRFPVIDCLKLRELPMALIRRVIRHAIRALKGNLRGIDYEHIEAVVRKLGREGGSGCVHLPGVEVIRSMDWLRFAPASRDVIEGTAVPDEWCVPIVAPGEAVLPGAIRLRLRSVEPERGYNGGEAGSQVSGLADGEYGLDWDKIEGPLTLRSWLPGDAYRPAGTRQAEKIKRMFQKARIPLWERRFWPILETGKGIVWSRRFGPSVSHQATSASHRVLGVQEIPAE